MRVLQFEFMLRWEEQSFREHVHRKVAAMSQAKPDESLQILGDDGIPFRNKIRITSFSSKGLETVSWQVVFLLYPNILLLPIGWGHAPFCYLLSPPRNKLALPKIKQSWCCGERGNTCRTEIATMKKPELSLVTNDCRVVQLKRDTCVSTCTWV